ncbi:LysR family transcriptional regulator [Methylobacterium sp. ID0610]|uniref:LysR family transcriptional regulator n=1 Tax=Methylobacterium carpenticola TaxID=3344827 RepID=UPI0036D00A4B
MDFARLRTLRELSLRKTMASVADALLISPSAVSQQIALLEAEVGIELVERRGRGVSLTPAGERLVEHASRIIAIVEEAKTDLAELKRIVAGELRVAAFPSAAASLIPPTIVSMAAAYPALRTTFVELEPAEGLAALRAWQTDLAIVDDLTTETMPPGPSVEMVHLLDDTLYVLMPPSHPLAERPFVTLPELSDQRFALDTSIDDYSGVIVRACRQAGFEPIINGKCHGFEVVRALIVAGCSISIQPGLHLRNGADGLVFKAIRPTIRRSISVAYRAGEGRNPAIRAFVSDLTARAGAIGGPA